MLEKRKNFGLSISETFFLQKKKTFYLQNYSMEEIETCHVKYSPWEISGISFLICHRWLRYDVIIAYVKRFIQSIWKSFEGHLGINCMGGELMMSSVTWFGSHIYFNTKAFKNLLWNGWTDWGKTLQVWSPIHKEQNVIYLWRHKSHGLATMVFLKHKPLKTFDRTA